jgi:hypothetical protein
MVVIMSSDYGRGQITHKNKSGYISRRTSEEKKKQLDARLKAEIILEDRIRAESLGMTVSELDK